jgi:NhaP-type Na+/H+ or K+/H+ antiporter
LPGEMFAAVHLLDICLVLSLCIVIIVTHYSGFVFETTWLWLYVLYGLKFLFPSPPHLHHNHMSLTDFVVSPPSCGWSVTNFWGCDAHEARLRCLDEVDGAIWIWNTRRGLKPKFY